MSVRKWTHIIIHHTGAEEKDADQVRRYHLSLGWRDVGYHYVVERDGRVVQGRGLDLVGAHCKASSMNYKGIGIAVIGNLQNHSILPAQEKAVVQLAGDLMGRFAIPLSNVLGHNEVPGAATACPGRHFSMASLRSAVKSGGGGVGVLAAVVAVLAAVVPVAAVSVVLVLVLGRRADLPGSGRSL
jgi:N-acetylmuramoyl-L-alanine amidase